MRAGNVSSGSAQLMKAAERLEIAWNQTREHWNDANSVAFEDDEFLPLLHAVKLAVESTQIYGSVVRQSIIAVDPEAREWLG